MKKFYSVTSALSPAKHFTNKPVEMFNGVSKKLVQPKCFVPAFIFLAANLFFLNSSLAQIAQRGAVTTNGTGGTTLTITKPGVQVGDVMIANIVQYYGSTPVGTPTSSGWTMISTSLLTTSTQRRGTVLYRVVDGTEPVTTISFALGNSTYAAGAIVAFSGVDVTGGFLVGGGAGGPFDVAPGSIFSPYPAANPVAIPAISTITANAAVIMFGMNSNITPRGFTAWSTTSPGSLTEIYDQLGANYETVGAAWKPKPTAGSTGTSSFTMQGGADAGGILLALRPLPPNTIATGAISPLTYCGGNIVGGTAVTVPFTSTGTFNAGNVYTAQLSNNGFTSSTSISTLASTSSGSLSISGTIPAGTTAGANYRIRVISSNPSVTGSNNGSDITISNPVAPTGASPQAFCASAAPTVAGLTATGSAGSTIQWYAASSGGTALSPATALVDNTHYYASQTVLGCEGSARKDVMVTLNASPFLTSNPSLAGQNLCLNGSSTALTVSATGAGLHYQWYSNATQTNSGGSPVGTDAASYTPLTTTAGTVYYYCIVTGTCTPSATSNASGAIVVNPKPVAGAITGATGSCIGSNTTLTPNATGAGTLSYTWSSSIPGVAIVSSAGVVTGVSAGSTNITYTVTDGNGCVATSLPFVFGVTPTAGDITGVAGTCAGNTVNLSSHATGVGTLTYVWNSTNTAVATVDNTGSVIAQGLGTTTITYTVTDGNGCSATSADFTFSVTTPTANDITAASNSVCIGSTLTLTSHASGVATLTYTWSSSNLGVATVPGTAATTTLTPVSAGSTDITYTVKDGNGCTAMSGIFTVTVNALPAAPTGATGASLCGTGSVSISVDDPGAGFTIDWYTVATNGTAVATNTTSYTTPSISGNTTYYAQTRNTTTGCVSASRTAVTATINAVPAATTTSANGATCGPGIVTISATAASGLTIDWYDASSGGTLLQSGTATGVNSFTTPSISTNTNYYAEVRNISTGCVSASRRTVTASVNAVPSPPAGTDVARCGTGTVTISASLSGAVIDWYANSTGGSALASGSNTFTTPSISANTTYYAQSRVSGTGCISATRTAVTATVNALPAAPTGATGASLCGTGSVSISVDDPGAGFTIDWYTVATNGTAVATNTTSYTTPSISGNTTYYAQTRNTTTGCVSASRTAVTATINAVPAATTTSANGATCGPGIVTISATAASGLTIDWYDASSGGTLLQSGTATGVNSFTTPSISTNTNYYAEVRNISTGCVSASRRTVTASVNAVPSPPAGTDVARCGTGTVTISASLSGAVIDWYANSTGGSALASGSNTFTTPSISANTTYYAQSRVSGTGCISATRTAVTATVNAVPAAPTGATGGSRCGTGTVTISVDAPGAGLTIDWYTVATNGTAVATNTTSYTTPSISGNTTYYAQTRNTTTGCVSASRTAVTATVNTPPAPPTITPTSATICQNTIQSLFSGTTTVTNATASSAVNLNLAIPDNSATGAANALTIAGIPVGSVINSVSVNFNISHHNDGDLIINLKAPNGQVLNLVNRDGGSNNDFANTTIASNGVTSLAYPFTGTFSADSAGLGTVGANAGGGNAVTTTSFPVLFGTPNGNWQFSARDVANNTSGTINNWSIKINYTAPATPQLVTWSPITDLYTDADATIAYTAGLSTATVYLKPASSGPKTYTATYTDGSGCSSSTNANITVNPQPAGVLSATETSGNINNDNIICAGSQVVFQATQGFGAYIFKVNGNIVQAGTGYTYSVDTLTNGASVTVDVSNNFNCGTTFGPVVISVIPIPIPTLISDKISICIGDTVKFTAGGGINYNFKLNGSSVQSGSAATYKNWTLNDGDSVTVDVTSANGCVATSAKIVIGVNPLPSGITLSSSGSTVCLGSSITFTATAVPGDTYDFKVNGSSVQNSTDNTYTIASAALTDNGHIVTVDVTNGSGCMASFGPPQVITVNLSPTGSLVATENSGVPDNNVICAGLPVKFTATFGYGNYAFYLNGIGTALYNGPNNSYTISTLNDQDYLTVVVTSAPAAGGCTSTFPSSPKITVYQLPVGTLSAAATTICAGDAIEFHATPGYSNYNFKRKGITFQNGTDSIATYTGFADGDQVTVDVSDVALCSSTFNTLTIHVNPLPSGILTGVETSGAGNNDSTICAGAHVDFKSTTGFTNYNFKLNGITVLYGSSTTYPTDTLKDGDVVSVEVTSSTNCVATFNTVKMTVHPLPPVKPITGPAQVCVNGIITLADITPGGSWSSGNSAIATVIASGANAGQVTGKSDGTVTVYYTVSNGFSCDSIVKMDIMVNALPDIDPIMGTFTFCVGKTSQLTDNIDGGVWSSSDNSVATVDITGLVNGISAGNIEIYYTTTNVATGCSSVDSANVIVNALPVVDEITGTLKVCVNSTTQLANITSGGLWSSSDPSIASVVASGANAGLVTGKTGGSVTISYSVTSVDGCNTTVDTALTVNLLPIPTLIGPNPICPNSANNIYTTELGQTNYSWSFSGGTKTVGGTSLDNSITITWGATGPYSVYVNYMDANGCSGDTSVTVTSNTAITPTLSGDQIVCASSNGIYTTDASETNYIWTISGTPGTDYQIISGGDATSNTATIKWLTPGARIVKISFTDPNGCNAAAPTSLNITVNTLPTATISGNASVCPGPTPQQVTFTGASGTAPYTFLYTINGGTDQTVTTTAGTSITVDQVTTTAGPFVYHLKSVSDYNGCSQTMTVPDITVTVNPIPTVYTVAGGGAYCSGGPGVDITLSGSETGVNYQLYNGTTAVGSAAGGTGIAIGFGNQAGAGTYTVKASNATTFCKSDMSGNATVAINPLPTVYTVTGGGAYCSGGTGVVVGLANSQSGVNYQLLQDGSPAGSVVSGTGASISFGNQTAEGNYTVIATDGTTTCTSTMSGSVVVSINPLPTPYTVTGGGAYCAGGVGTVVGLSGSQAGVNYQLLKDGSSVGAAMSGTGNPLDFGSQTAAGIYTVLATGGAPTNCPNTMTGSVTVTVNPLPAQFTVTGGGPYCSGGPGVPVGLSGSESGVSYQLYKDAVAVGSPITGTGSAISFGSQTVGGNYTVIATGGAPTNCPNNMTGSVTVTVNPLPTATISGMFQACQNGPSPTITFTGANGTAPYIFTYNINGTGTTTITSVGNVATLSAPTNTLGGFTYNLVSVKDASSTTCSNTISLQSATVTVNSLPVISLLPYNSLICQSDIQPLSATSVIVPPTVTASAASPVNLNRGIPDATSRNYGEVNTSLSIGGIPAGAVVTDIRITLNINHTYDGDLNFNIKDPYGNILNLINNDGGSGDNFANTIISAAATLGIPYNGAPYTGTYKPDAATGIGPAGNRSNVTSFTNLTSVLNGTWTLYAEDTGPGDNGQINNWSIAIDYYVPVVNPVTWSPVTDLYTNSAATIPYTIGQSLTTVYLRPSSGGMKVYTATATNAAGCTNSAQATITVGTPPVIAMSTDYCKVPGKVVVTASSSAGVTFKWASGQITDTIQVDEAGNYTVTGTSPQGCKGTGTISVAQELVINGDFETGGLSPQTTAGLGFTSDYAFKPDLTGVNNELVPDNANIGYSITPNGRNVHNDFWGYDHTKGDGSGNFMAVNGHLTDTTQHPPDTLVVWKETVSVLPNTTYYFSAWAKSLNSAGPFAKLKFSVNGKLTGSEDDLASGVRNDNNGQPQPVNAPWTRFYGQWTSDSTTTTAQIYINDLEPAYGGNDFGLDDISFATLSTFINLISAPGTDAQTVCVNTPVTDIVYRVGNGNAGGPNVIGLPDGLTSIFNGDKLTFSGTPTKPGNYTYTITTTGCKPYSVTGTIKVLAQKLTLTSGNASPIICINTLITPIVYQVSGSGGSNATVKGLPDGLSGNYNISDSTFTISGMPSIGGVFKDTVISTGTCRPDTAYGTITVQNQIITLSSGDTIQSRCLNNAVSTITYSVGGTATFASVAGLPDGVIGQYSAKSFIISGAPIAPAAGVYHYTVTTSGTCSPAATTTGIITVNPDAVITLTSGGGTDGQSFCINQPLTNITYSISGGGTGASITSGVLPHGVSGSFASGVFTITGTPDTAGVFNYAITTTGTCAQATASGTITVQKQLISLKSGSNSPTNCVGATLPPIVFTVGGSATFAAITGGVFPNGVTGNYDAPSKTYTISGIPSQLGAFSYTITTSGTCATDSIKGTITINSGSVGGSIQPSPVPAICSGAGGILNLVGSTGNVLRWESSTDGGVTWPNKIANNTTSYNYAGLTVPSQFRAVVKSGSCDSVYSSVAIINIHNYWVGITSTDWNTASNWSDGAVPTLACEVYIPKGTNFDPILNTGTTSVSSLHILTNGFLTINNAKLQVNGGITNTGGILDATIGTIEFNGGSQTISGSVFKDRSVKNLIVSSTGGLSLTNTSGDTLKVLSTLSFGNATSDLTTYGNLTLRSTITNTANVDVLQPGNEINGDVNVERYIATGSVHPKSWQLLAIPTSSGIQTIHDAWQEGCAAAVACIFNYGILINNNVIGGGGFDITTGIAAPTMKIYDYTIDDYKGVSGTNIPIYDKKGYFVFVRGDRSVSTFATPKPTTLRTKGPLFTAAPGHLPPTTIVQPNKFESVGNPYASAIDVRLITRSTGVEEFFQVWDPNLGGAYGYGGFQTLLKLGPNDYYANPGGGIYGGYNGIAGPNIPFNFIQSGQAFFVQADGSPGPNTVSFDESAKAGGSVLFTTPSPVQQQVSLLRTILYDVHTDGSTGNIVDGTLNQFGESFTNAIDGLDARKQANTGVNLGIKTAGKLLAVERRKLPTEQDTIFLNLTGVSAQNYRFHFDADNLGNNLEAFLEDSYLKTRTPISVSGSTDVSFTVVNVAGSYAADRFRIVFATQIALPVTFTSLKAYQQDKNINVEWRVENEADMKQYEVEKSIDGTSFSSIAVKQPSANNGGSAMYVIIDAKPVEGYNYYRIRSVDMSGKVSYTNVVKVLIGTLKQDIVIYPNPITDGMIHLQLMNQPEGKYKLRLLNNLGQLIVQKQVTHAGGNSTQLLKWDYNLAHGMYQLEITRPDGTIKNLNVLY